MDTGTVITKLLPHLRERANVEALLPAASTRTYTSLELAAPVGASLHAWAKTAPAHDAETFAAACDDPATLTRLARDSRKGVRRLVGLNHHTPLEAKLYLFDWATDKRHVDLAHLLANHIGVRDLGERVLHPNQLTALARTAVAEDILLFWPHLARLGYAGTSAAATIVSRAQRGQLVGLGWRQLFDSLPAGVQRSDVISEVVEKATTIDCELVDVVFATLPNPLRTLGRTSVIAHADDAVRRALATSDDPARAYVATEIPDLADDLRLEIARRWDASDDKGRHVWFGLSYNQKNWDGALCREAGRAWSGVVETEGDEIIVEALIGATGPVDTATKLTLLRCGTRGTTIKWLKSTGPNAPRAGEAASLFADPGIALVLAGKAGQHERISDGAAVAAVAGAISPEAPEAIIDEVVAFAQVSALFGISSPQPVAALARRLEEAFGANPGAVHAACTLAGTWDGTVGELIDATRLCTAA